MVVDSEQDRGGIKQITTCFIVRFFRKNEHPFFRLITIFFFSYITWSLFSSYGTLPRYLWTSHFYLYQMAITTSVLFLSQYITYQTAYYDSTYSFCCYYYINVYMHCHFIPGRHSYCLFSRRFIYYSRGWIYLHMTSSFPIFHILSISWTWSHIFWIWPRPYLQHMSLSNFWHNIF